MIFLDSAATDPDVPISKGKNRSRGVKTSPDPSNPMDEELTAEETDEQIPIAAESNVNSPVKILYHFMFVKPLVDVVIRSIDLEKKKKILSFLGRRK